MPAVRKQTQAKLSSQATIIDPKKILFVLFTTMSARDRARRASGEDPFFRKFRREKSYPAWHPRAVKQDYLSLVAILQSPGKRISQIAHELLIPLSAFLFVPMKARHRIFNFAISSTACMGVSYRETYSFKIIFRGNADSARINLLRESIPLRATMKASKIVR